MMPRRDRIRLLLLGLAKLAAVVLVAGSVGVGIGVVLAALTDEDDSAGEVSTDAPAAAQRSSPRVARRIPTTSTTSSASAAPGRPQVGLTVSSAVLHPAATPSGILRRRARLGVHIKVQNRGAETVVLPRPSLLAARQRIPTNPRADRPGTALGPLDAGMTADVTLQFETAGAVTDQLTTQKTAHILVAGRTWPITVEVGRPAQPAEQPEPAAP
jgi:hypothetical protein